MFGVGAVLAKNHERLTQLYQRLGVKSRIVLGVAALEALGYGLMVGLAATGRAWAGELLLVPAAGIVIVAALADSHWQKFLNRPSCQFLGKISYSLYLVHMAVLLPLVFLTWETALGHLPYYWVLLFVTFVGISVGLAWLFWGAIETRATNWSRSFGWQKAPASRAAVAGAAGGLTETSPG
jgi:peptidoglycan/LPS O-acetylase OafA/YrhL